MRSSSSQLLKTIDLLYGSILDEQHLSHALEALSDFGGGRGAYCMTFDQRTGIALRARTVGLDPEAVTEYGEHYLSDDVRISAALKQPLGSLVTEHKCVDQAAFETSELYRDFLTRYDIPHIVGLLTATARYRLSAVSIKSVYAKTNMRSHVDLSKAIMMATLSAV